MTAAAAEAEGEMVLSGLYRPRVLLIGAGPTSALIAAKIRRNEKLGQLFDLNVWEKSRNVGGRFATMYSPPGSADNYVDSGAQYLSRTAGHASEKYFQGIMT
jgi:predicted NAD/FAD-dependent oxidoreductase